MEAGWDLRALHPAAAQGLHSSSRSLPRLGAQEKEAWVVLATFFAVCSEMNLFVGDSCAEWKSWQFRQVEAELKVVRICIPRLAVPFVSSSRDHYPPPLK